MRPDPASAYLTGVCVRPASDAAPDAIGSALGAFFAANLTGGERIAAPPRGYLQADAELLSIQ